MASILNPTLSYESTSASLGSPVRVEVNFRVRFTPMERLLANYGLWFRVRISFYDLDSPPSDHLDSDDDHLQTRFLNIPSMAVVGAPASNILPQVFSEVFDRPELRGPNDDGSEYSERLRAQICIFPRPVRATEVFGACELSNYELIDTQGPIVESVG